MPGTATAKRARRSNSRRARAGRLALKHRRFDQRATLIDRGELPKAWRERRAAHTARTQGAAMGCARSKRLNGRRSVTAAAVLALALVLWMTASARADGG